MATEKRVVVNNRVERKVVTTTVAATVTSLVLHLLGTYVFHDAVPEAVATAVAVIVPAAVTFLTGYWSKHTVRTPFNR